MSELADRIMTNINKGMENDLLSNDNLVQIIELCGSYLNLCSRSEYSKQNKISYNGAKKHRKNIKLFGQTFIIDNK